MQINSEAYVARWLGVRSLLPTHTTTTAAAAAAAAASVRCSDDVSSDLSDERYEVMFTHGEHIDVTNNDHLVVILVEDGIVQYV